MTSIGVLGFILILEKTLLPQRHRGTVLKTNFFRLAYFLWVSVPLWLMPLFVLAGEDELRFLPPEPVFDRLIGDPREPQNALIADLNYPRFEEPSAPSWNFLQWRLRDGAVGGWGIQGASFIELDSLGDFVYPERVSDWYLGMYFSESSGFFSHRLDYTHVSSHLGDELFGFVPRIIYSRESFRWITSYQPGENFRIFAGAGYSPHIAPEEKAFLLHGGMELYTNYFGFLFGTVGRAYFTYDIKIKQEAGGVVNQNFQWGFQWKWKKETSQASVWRFPTTTETASTASSSNPPRRPLERRNLF